MAYFREIVARKKPVLILFFTELCESCKRLSQILKKVANEMGDDVKVIKIDVDENLLLTQKLRVRTAPTLMIYKEEILLWRQSGFVPKAELIKALKEFK